MTDDVEHEAWFVERQGWMKAGGTLALDPTQHVTCPSCGKATLSVKNLPSDEHCVERHIFCLACKRGEQIYKPVGHVVPQVGEER
jgi:hypothetical protein